jgi:hypothetical protein
MHQRHAMMAVGVLGVLAGLFAVALGVDVLRHLDDPPGADQTLVDTAPADEYELMAPAEG